MKNEQVEKDCFKQEPNNISCVRRKAGDRAGHVRDPTGRGRE
jgi:hypothetical protein